jgi:3-deoxy-manno-octulosonate cytidylyltransferase (CMP-KDO synthetase)
MRACVLIPARHASTRFPGKPLVPLLGKPMVLWVAELSARAVGREHVYVATESETIRDVVEAAGFNALMTADTALTGTDRIAEAAALIDYDVYINVQGDEPLVDPADIQRCLRAKEERPDLIINGFSWIGPDEDPNSRNIPKVIANERGEMVYMSRVALPGFKDAKCAPTRYMKQVCIYCFTREELRAFAAFGRKSALEACEDIEILRFLELGRTIAMVETRPGSLAVDVVSDVDPVETALRGLHTG